MPTSLAIGVPRGGTSGAAATSTGPTQRTTAMCAVLPGPTAHFLGPAMAASDHPYQPLLFYEPNLYLPPPPHSPYLAYGDSTYQGSDPNRLQSTTHSIRQPWQHDHQSLPRSPSCWCPPSHCRPTAALLAAAQPPPPPQSHSTALLQQSRKFINSSQQHGLPNNPDLMVRSFSHAQLAPVNDYNEKLRVYRLDQAALLARVTAWFAENTDDEDITEENVDNTPTTVLCADVHKAIHDVPNSITDVAINTAVGVDVSDEVERSEDLKTRHARA